MKKIFITFGGPSIGYRKRVNELTSQAKNLGFFDIVIGLTDQNLYTFKDFIQMHNSFLNSNWRGYGYWIWKSYIIKQLLLNIDEGDIILYCDAGCELNAKGIDRLNDYFNIVNQSETGILTFTLPYPEKQFTKNDLFVYLNSSEDDKNSMQHMATTFLIKKCETSIKFIDDWYQICCNYRLIDDSPSITANDILYCEHRHDQSVLSLMAKKYKSASLPDETYFNPNWEINGIKYPIWAKRNRG